MMKALLKEDSSVLMVKTLICPNDLSPQLKGTIHENTRNNTNKKFRVRSCDFVDRLALLKPCSQNKKSAFELQKLEIIPTDSFRVATK